MTSCMLYLCLSGSLAGSQAGEALPPPASMAPALASRAEPDCPVTLCDFARGFQPVPGNYEVLFVHPVKGCPVRVCFTLPPGCPRVCLSKRAVVFDYGCRAVTIHFKILCGRVKVVYS